MGRKWVELLKPKKLLGPGRGGRDESGGGSGAAVEAGCLRGARVDARQRLLPLP
ncbi:unnamed protein product, partial [Musa textilis]